MGGVVRITPNARRAFPKNSPALTLVNRFSFNVLPLYLVGRGMKIRCSFYYPNVILFAKFSKVVARKRRRFVSSYRF